MKPQTIRQTYLSEPFELGEQVDTNNVLFYGGGDFVVIQSLAPFMKTFSVETFTAADGSELAKLRIIIERLETEEEVAKRVNDEVALFHQFRGREVPIIARKINPFAMFSGVTLVPILHEVIDKLNEIHDVEWSTDFEESWGKAVMLVLNLFSLNAE